MSKVNIFSDSNIIEQELLQDNTGEFGYYLTVAAGYNLVEICLDYSELILAVAKIEGEIGADYD